MDDGLMLDDDQVALVERAAAKLMKHGDATLRALVAEIEDDDATEEILARAALVDALLPGGD